MAAAAYRDATAAAAAVGSRIMALNLGPSKGPTGPQRSDSRYDGRGLGKDPLLSRYICNTAVGSDQRLALSNVLAQLTAAAAQEDRAGKTALASALRLLFLFERLTPEAAAQLAELLEREASDPRLLKPIGHLLGAHVAGGCAGTPTTFHPALLRADDRATKAALATLSAALAAPALEPGVQRALLLLLAAVARGSKAARAALTAAIEAAIRASDEAATSGASPGAASDWTLQHSVFLAARAGGVATGADSVSRAAFVGLGSPDPVGARHALSLALLVAAREPGSVALEMGTVVADAADAYALANGGDEAAADGEAGNSDAPTDTPKKPSPITLSDPFARLALARLCACVVHSEGRASNVDGDGAPFWRMLCLLATRDSADVVRFGALEALVGGAEDAAGPLGRGAGASGANTTAGAGSASSSTPAVPSTVMTTLPTTSFTRGSGGYVSLAAAPLPLYSAPSSAATTAPAPRSEAALRQRSARAWRLLVRRAGERALIPGLPGGRGRMGLLEAVGALLTLALRKADDAPRRRAALGAVCALARGCLADRAKEGNASSGGAFYGARGAASAAAPVDDAADAQRVLGALGTEVQALLEGALSAPERCAALQAALLLGAVGACSPLTPAKVLASGAAGGAEGPRARGWAPSLQSLACGTVLECARARPSEAPALLSLAHAIVGLSPAGSDVAQLVSLWEAACEGAGASAPAAAGARARAATVRAVLALLSAPPPPAAAAPALTAGAAEVARAAREAEGWTAVRAAAAWWLGERVADLTRSASGAAPRGAAADDGLPARVPSALLAAAVAELGRALQTGAWELRCAAARALGTLAVRCGEPARARAYALLSRAAAAHGAAAGVAPVALPILDVLDRVYASQAALGGLFEKNGADAAAWPAADAVAVARRAAELQRLVEARVCAAPRGRYCLLGHRAASLLAAHPATADAAAFDVAGKDEAVDEGESALAARDSVGAELVKQKNDEVAAILSGTGGGAPASPAYRFAGGAADLSDKNDEIEAMLFGKPATDPNRAFETFGTASAASPKAAGALATWPEEEEEETGGEGAWAGADAPAPSPPSFGDAGAPASPHAPVERTAVVAHMFVADYAEPDELSVFEGDTVAILEETEGWALVRDPSGAQGLVPLSYLHLNYASSVNGGHALRSPSRPTSRAHSRQPSGAWERQPSLTARYSRTKEDLLDDVFASAAAESSVFNDPFAAPSPRQPGTPGAFRRGASAKAATEEDAALFGGAFDYSAPAPTESLPRGASSRGQSPGGASGRRRFGSGDWGGALPGRLSRQEGDAGSGGLLKSAGTASQHRRSASGGAASPLGTTSPRARPSSAESDGGKLIVAPFTAEMEGELSVAPGDKVQVHSDVDGWARVVRLADGRSGLVPSWAVAGP